MIAAVQPEHPSESRDKENDAFRKPRILVISHGRAVGSLLQQLLSGLGEVKIVASNAKIFQTVENYGPTLILLCLDLRDQNGITLCRRLKARKENRTELVVISSQKTDTSVLHSVRKIVDGHLVRPLSSSTVRPLINHLIERHRQIDRSNQTTDKTDDTIAVESAVDHVTASENAFSAPPGPIYCRKFESEFEIFKSLQMIGKRHGNSEDDAINIAMISGRIAQQLKSRSCYTGDVSDEFLRNLHLAAQLYDLSSAPIEQDAIEIDHKPNAMEIALFRRHAEIGGAIFDEYIRHNPGSTLLRIARDAALSHRERWDGTGFPVGLSGTAIPLASRIVSIALTYHTLTAERRFRKPFRAEVARDIILKAEGKQFDPIVVRSFQQVFEENGFA